MATFTRKAIMQTFLHILKNKPLDRIQSRIYASSVR